MAGTQRITNILFALILFSGTLLFAIRPLNAAAEYVFTGKTMGTTYAVKVVSAKPLSQALWQEKIDQRLKQVNACLSMYRKSSELSRFNALPAGKSFTVSPDFYQVLVQCKDLHALTRGAWDGTVKTPGGSLGVWHQRAQNHPAGHLPDSRRPGTHRV